jgi:hypothetical protein
VKTPTVCASLIVIAALLSPQHGVADEPTGTIVPAPGSSIDSGWRNRAQANQPIPTQSRLKEASNKSSARPSEIERSAKAGFADPGESGAIQTEDDSGAFLLPVWDRGFWVMPPGGMTRRLLPAPGFVNPEVTLTPGRGTH